MFDVDHMTMVETRIALLTIAGSYCSKLCNLCQTSTYVIYHSLGNFKYCMNYHHGPPDMPKNVSPVHVKLMEIRRNIHACMHACMHTYIHKYRVINYFVIKTSPVARRCMGEKARAYDSLHYPVKLCSAQAWVYYIAM